ncbi:MAG TPA: toll/interleukin-1 receptor domain-containing protein [Pyrinomonadaceae bacterium]|jgi:hypothetical protein
MRERINKPRVFLSHARKDVEFIERIERDLRRCQIEPWRDINEIRDGEPWQNVIFAEGIPACDVVITYYTENSITSQMVSKEVDSTLLRQLSDNGIGFLPYVNTDQTRNNLRLDIQALQCRVWNDANYNEVLPSVVAEIWRRYTERAIPLAVSIERAKRLELEIELKNVQSRMSDSVFPPQEENEFQYIYSKLEGFREAKCHVSIPKDAETKKPEFEEKGCLYKYSFLDALVENVSKGQIIFDDKFLDVIKFKEYESFKEFIEQGYKFGTTHNSNALKGLLTRLGLLIPQIERVGEGYRGYNRTTLLFSEKLFRFVSWLDYYKKVDGKPNAEFIKFLESAH